jgi:hypothetical protein
VAVQTTSRSDVRDPSFAQALYARASGSLSCLANARAQDAVAEYFLGHVMSWIPVLENGFQNWRSPGRQKE